MTTWSRSSGKTSRAVPLLLVALAAGCAAPEVSATAPPTPTTTHAASADAAEVASPSPSPGSTPSPQDAAEAPEADSAFLSSSASDVAAFLEGADVDATAMARCVEVTYLDPTRLTKAVWMPFSDALAINTVLTSIPEWPFARGDDNRMTVALRGEDQQAPTAVCVMTLDIASWGFGHDVLVIFSDDTFGEIGMY